MTAILCLIVLIFKSSIVKEEKTNLNVQNVFLVIIKTITKQNQTLLINVVLIGATITLGLHNVHSNLISQLENKIIVQFSILKNGFVNNVLKIITSQIQIVSVALMELSSTMNYLLQIIVLIYFKQKGVLRQI